MSQSVEGWEREFDERFSLPPDFMEATAGNNYVPNRKYFITFPQEIKSFIRSTLSTLVKKMEGLKRTDETQMSEDKIFDEGISAAVEVVKKMGIT